jgi:hypothetical protein
MRILRTMNAFYLAFDVEGLHGTFLLYVRAEYVPACMFPTQCLSQQEA